MRAKLTLLAGTLAFALLVPWTAPAVAAPARVPPVDVSAASQNAEQPQVGAAQNEETLAVWRRFDGSNWIVQESTRPAGGSFSTPDDLSAPGKDASSPRLAVNWQGNAVAVWVCSNGANEIVQASTRLAGGSFAAPVDLSAAGEDAGEPRVAIDNGGNATAVWERSDGSNDIVQASTLDAANGTWSVPQSLSGAGQSAAGPDVAIDYGGDVAVVWRRSDGSNDIVQAATRVAHGSFSAPEDLSLPGQDAGEPQVAMNETGDAVAIWERSNGANDVIQEATWPDGGSFSTPVDLSALGGDAGSPRIAMDGVGETIVAWRHNSGGHYVVEAASGSADGQFSPPQVLSAPDTDAEQPSVASNGGQRAVAWTGFDGSAHFVAASIDSGSGFSTPIRLSGAGQSAGEPDVAVYPSNRNATAVWERSDGANEIVQASGYDANGPQLFDYHIHPSDKVGEPILFVAEPFDAWSQIVSAGVDFGDGDYASGTSVSHAY